ncbi:ABA4-like family protein [Flavihumibacter sp. UBA7668]|uniref:ABA4-like family protein n=1 Tax=Flavihumibacter sp. UBA7668 TaxID=1946542 RepID=UPI0025C4D54B|nr:ABA4-like family protein [Flavihumibacter sp. UBA7668]
MSADQLFQLSSTAAMLAWILLIIFHKTLWISKALIGTIILAMSLLYFYLIAKNFGGMQPDSFSTLDGVAALFTNREALLAGWVHYLAFDLMTGIFIVNNARKNGIGIGWLLPCLFFTFMLGPVGLLLYILIRWIHTKNYWIDVE